MRKIFLDNLPKWGAGNHEGKIKWKETVGEKVKFIYDDIEGELEIIDIYTENRTIYIDMRYESYNCRTTSSDFLKCRLGNLLLKHTTKYKYDIGDIIDDVNLGKIQILDSIKIIHRRKDRKDTYEKAYQYRCLICGNVDKIIEHNLKMKMGCNVCSGKKVLRGYNDIGTTNPEVASLFFNIEDTYKYTMASDASVKVKCKDCGHIKNVIISSIVKSGKIMCPKCSDKISYPNKIIFNMLEQLNIDFENEKAFDWSNKRIYDFYIPNINCIIEAHGGQHYKESFTRIKSSKVARTLIEEQENDKIKQELASNNNIINYIVIDCQKSNFDFIKEKILNSKLSDLYDLSKINWLKCHEYACNSLVKEACNLWNNGIKSTTYIGIILKKSSPTILKYLKQGEALNWCDFDIKTSRSYGNKKGAKKRGEKVICLNTNEVFDTISDAELRYNTGNITNCCMHNALYGGIFHNGDYIQWQYYKDYLISPKPLRSNEEIFSLSHKRKSRKVICLNTNVIYDSLTEASIDINTSVSTLCTHIKNNKPAGKDPITGENLTWMYYDDYAKEGRSGI